MGNNYGPGPSRVLDPTARQFLDVIWQQGRPPLDSELTLLQDIASDWRRKIVMRGCPSGFLGNGTGDSESFVTSAAYSNWFRFGRQRTGEQAAIEWAVVNGWLIPVTGTRTGSPPGSPDNADTWNVIALNPPPSGSGDFRVDFVYLEVWLARVPPNPSSLNKPGSSAIYTYGNVEGGMSYLPDDIQDPNIGAETTERVQLQYRIGVQPGLVGLTTNPDGFDPAVVFARGASSTASTYNFLNMRSALGDPGLWRAGDGSSTAQTALGTVDGYSYAIPISGVFRRNSTTWNGDPSPNLNGGFNRNILAVDRTGIATYSTVPTLSVALTASATTLSLVSASGVPLPISPTSPVVIQIGDEQMTYTGITGTTMQGLVRGYNSTRAEKHAVGATISLVSGRPDGLFADQVAKTDILDLRHIVNPNGFDFDTLLRFNFDKLVRGALRSNWKRTGAGPQGPFLLYQDKVVSSGGSVALGISRLDAPNNIREVFSDAAVPQTIPLVVLPSGTAPIPSPNPATDVSVSWSLDLTVTATVQQVASFFVQGDVLVVPIAQFQTSLSGDLDQVRFINDGTSVTIRIDGQTDPLPTTAYTVTATHSPPLPGDDLTITFTTSFPGTALSPLIGQQLYIEVNIQYGPGRGLARRPDSLHGVAFENAPPGNLLYRASGTPSTNFPMHVGWSALCGSFRNSTFKGRVPVVTESYADPGSKTLILTPFRQIGMPANFLTMDGTAANVNTPTGPTLVHFHGVANGTTTFTDTVDAPFSPANVGEALLVQNGPQPGRYTVVSSLLLSPSSTVLSFTVTHLSASVTTTDTTNIANGSSIIFTSYPSVTYTVLSGGGGGTSLTLTTTFAGSSTSTTAYDPTRIIIDRSIPTGTSLQFSMQPAQGLMPLNDQYGNAKWTQTDPLQLFANSVTSLPNAASRNLYVQLPRELVPAWGEYHVPIVTTVANAPANFSEGVNYMMLTVENTNGNTNYVPYIPQGTGGSASFQTFSTVQLGSIIPITYNTALSGGSGGYYAGMRHFTDSRGLGRQGLELPPFYGVARLFAVYEAADYNANGTAYNTTTRAPTGSLTAATNLLRQNMGQNDGPTFWVEIDSDGDSTFILNANAIDITRSPNAIANFASGNYVIEASIWGFDRGFFDLTQEARLVLSSSRTQAISSTRANNIGTGTNGTIVGPNLVIPGPLVAGDAVLATYSRTPYMGDAWGTQTNYTDISQQTGPLQSTTAYQLASTTLNPTALTRPYQKLLEVVASVGFVTTLGTGRTVGDTSIPPEYDIRDIGYEDPTQYPPTNPGQARPTTLGGNFVGETEHVDGGGEYLGCTERLPLGALFLDKDFRGEPFGGVLPAPFLVTSDLGAGLLGSLAVSSSLEQTEAFVQGVDLASGQPGNLLVHVDGNQTNYNLVTNFRVNRGGSVFNASGHNPGGEVAGVVSSLQSSTGHTNVVCGRAFLVRNTVTTGVSSEVSAGDELMMLVVTSVVRLIGTGPYVGQVVIGTNGSYEGYSAADLYRCEGHPLLNDNVRNDLNPATIQLSPPAFNP